MGCAVSIIFTVIGASYGTAKSSGAIFSAGVIRPDRMMQNTCDHPIPYSHFAYQSPSNRTPIPAPVSAQSWPKSSPYTAS